MKQLISIIIPVYNEEENINLLNESVTDVMNKEGYNYEIIYTDDGSTDGSPEILDKLAAENSRIKVVTFAKRYGQTAAFQSGINYSNGDIIIPLDADLQNPPEEIPKMLELYNQGYDIVSGWRKKRQDNFVRKIPSKIANLIISSFTGLKLHDYGCSLKIYNAKILKKIRLYGELHRFVPAVASKYGAKVIEIPVNHSPRKFGKSKYNLSRTTRVILDLITVTFFLKYSDRPMYFAGYISLAVFMLALVSFIIGLFLSGSILLYMISLLITIMSFLFGILFLILGLLAEFLMKIYYESTGNKIYNVKKYSGDVDEN